jgi:hypothetical protein
VTSGPRAPSPGGGPDDAASHDAASRDAARADETKDRAAGQGAPRGGEAPSSGATPRRWAVGLALLAVIAAAAAVTRDLVRHRRADATWAEMRGRQTAARGDASYDGARSDALYEAVWGAREAVRRDATWLGLALLALAALAREARPRPVASPQALPPPQPPPRRAVARALGRTTREVAPAVAALAFGLALAERLDRGGHEASAALLGRLAPWLGAATATLALPAATGGPGAPVRRALAGAAALGAVVWLPVGGALALLLAPRAPRLARALAAPHRALAGLD